MQVETFECAEVAAEPIEASEEAIRLIDEMGLAGQRELVTLGKAGHETRSPYREMLNDEVAVYSILCPQRTDLAKYNASPIPLRVLQVAAHAVTVIPGCRLRVWDRAEAAVKDPVLVAETGKYDWSADKRFILARWGEELETFVTLAKRAAAAKREFVTAKLRGLTSKVDGMSDAEVIHTTEPRID